MTKHCNSHTGVQLRATVSQLSRAEQQDIEVYERQWENACKRVTITYENTCRRVGVKTFHKINTITHILALHPRSSCTGRKSLCSASRGDFLVPHARTAIKQHRAFSIVVPLLGTVSHLNSALFHRICPACFASSSKLLFSPRPGLGAPLSSYLEVALHKSQRYIDR